MKFTEYLEMYRSNKRMDSEEKEWRTDQHMDEQKEKRGEAKSKAKKLSLINKMIGPTMLQTAIALKETKDPKAIRAAEYIKSQAATKTKIDLNKIKNKAKEFIEK